MQAIFRV